NKWPEALREIVVRGLETRPPYKADPGKIDEELQRLLGNSTATEVGQRLIREYKNAADPLWQASGLPFPQASREMLRVWQQINPHQRPASNNPLIQADLVSTYDTYPAPLRLRYQ